MPFIWLCGYFWAGCFEADSVQQYEANMFVYDCNKRSLVVSFTATIHTEYKVVTLINIIRISTAASWL